MRSALVLSLLTLSATACLDEGKPDEEELDLLEDGKDDSFAHPTNHGAIAFTTPAHSALSATERHHAWTFALSGTAKVDLTTSYSVLGQRRTDTVLYLYKKGPTGWGPYIARNDDYGSTTYSQLVKNLGAGEYRVLVKGHLASTIGKFKVAVACTGAGCSAPAPSGCLFGETYGDLEGNPALTKINENTITIANLHTLSDGDKGRLVIAVKQSSHTDVTSPEEALDRVDQNEVIVSWWHEPAALRTFIAFEYGAGDNSYGAIFDRFSAQMVSKIHDGDLDGCIVTAETCLLSPDWSELRGSPAFTTESTRVITSASQLTTTVSIDQALQAIQRSQGAQPDLATALQQIDDNTLNIVAMKHKATGVRIEVFEFGAGDTSVGTIYYRNTNNPAGHINDLAIEACTLFAD